MNALMFLVVASVLPGQPALKYDPLVSKGQVEVVDTQFSYGNEERIVPLRMYLPKTDLASAVILFSHGLGGSRENSKYLGSHWAGRGYVVVFMQHAGSDRDVMANAGRLRKLVALKAAASPQSARDRYRDVKATIDHLETMNRPRSRYEGRFRLDRIGMSGHSFGAITTQAVSGQSFGPLGQVFTDDRIKAAVAFSPSPPAYGHQVDAFSKVRVPWLLMTGTQDDSPIGKRTDPDSRRLVFKQLPSGGQFYEVVFEGGKHSAFSDRELGKSEVRNPNHHWAIQAISTAFWDSYLKNDSQAKQWLTGASPKKLLDSADIWQMK